MNIPKIEVSTPSAKKESSLFNKFLNHPNFPQHRNLIFSAFPKLKELLSNKSKEKEENIVNEFVSGFYQEHCDKIEEIGKSMKIEATEKLIPGVKDLAVLMDYEWSNDHPGYIAIPSILPFSPFETNVFYFSILGELRGSKGKGVAFIGVHEISHFILFDVLDSIYGEETKKELNNNLIYFLKEILAPVLMNQLPLANLLSVENYLGNPNLKEIYILDQSGKKIQISRYFQNIYEKEKADGKVFSEIVKEMVQILRSIQNEIDERQKLWNMSGGKIYQDETLLQKYSESIKITP
ncbi:hypothetical protein D4R99_02590 [bacterium]|nr:MAG: hypothetical protein D4R99_02590 [bacterium]